MNKATLFASSLTLVALLLAGAPLADAQVYTGSVYSTPSYSSPVTSSACIELTSPMTIGDSDYLTGGQVSGLQRFLVNDGLLSSAYITGYYGQLTASAVAQFQASRGISPVGVVGPITRSAIQQVSCGNTVSINPGGPILNPSYGYYAPLELNSLSSNGVGSNIVITLSGNGFDPSDNIVHFGTAQITGVSSNGTQLSFSVPSVVAGTYQVYVATSRGQTNSLSYYYSGGTTSNCSYYSNGYQYNNCGNCVYPTNVYNDTNDNNCSGTNAVTITSLSGTSGYPGSSVTIYGSGFTSSNNSIYIGSNVISNVYSSNGTSLTFTVPSNLATYTNGSYSLYLTNGDGQSSNTLQFSVDSNGGGYTNNGSLSLYSLSPSDGTVGTQISIEGSGFSQVGNTVHFGIGGSVDVNSYNNGDTISFQIPSELSPCELSGTSICPDYEQLVGAGTYGIYVTNQSGQSSNTLNFEVN